ncbi:YggS family pyridoxal phosphate-dependent enzyme [Aureitalea sp. L0-47]|uniref:YggS family pyridoxal phosphate-dependent enzyme n=1 Tax=Aureitalea sp. L0-47 TaxID=2816962 RepID=UPI002237EEE9|nr:YggS family pyridoxal phosphate-dependent enzyme [Aureitalea sp. L0-47]MCW5519632.1 YggS family pyridoxal phosphate-dependent enzyme [Aureitalea sp. L0-47]
MNISENIKAFKSELPESITLVAVSKTKPVSDIMEAYNEGHRIFGENKIQEMAAKWEEMPADVQWHMIGHVQRNKVKYMAEFVSLVHAVDSFKLLTEINKQAAKYYRTINCLLQIKIAEEDSKFGMSADAAKELLESSEYQNLKNIRVTGLMGMATFTDNMEQVRREFRYLKNLYDELKDPHSFTELSMGMSGDFKIALEEGSTMVRVGSAIFGERNYG